MLKRLTAVLCCAGLLLTGCGEETATSAPNEMIGQLQLPEGLTLTPPAGFSETSSEAYACYYVRDDASIIFTEEPLAEGYDTPETYTKRALEQYQAATDSFTLVEEAACQAGALTGKTEEFSYTITISGKTLKLQSLTAYFLTENMAYIITCKSNSGTFADNRADFMAAIQSAAPVEPEK